MGGRRVALAFACAVASVVATAGPALAAPPPRVAPPASVTAATVSASAVDVTWSAVSGATMYDVSYATRSGGPYTPALRTTALTGRVTGLAGGTSYVFVVQTEVKKSTSGYSAEARATTLPAAPSGVTATATSPQKVHVAWSPVTGATGYQVLRATGTAAFVQVGSVPATAATAYDDATVAAATSYRYLVRATGAGGVSADSATASVTTPAKAATTVGVTLSAKTVAPGTPVTASVQVTSGASYGVPSGTVSLYDGQSLVSQAPLNPNGVAGFTFSLPSGSHPLVWVYSGDGSYASSTSATLVVTVTAGSPTFGPAVSYPVGSWPTSTVVADVNGDGRKDVVLSTNYYFDPANDYKLFVFLQQPGGGLAAPVRVDTAGGYTDSERLAAADIDGDGYDEVLLTLDAGVQVFRWRTTGLVAAATVPSAQPVQDLVVADVDGDAHPDLVLDEDSALVVVAGRGDGTFGDSRTIATGSSLSEIATGDLNTDGRVDVAALSTAGVTVWYQLADGSLSPGQVNPIATWGNAFTVGDVTGDGRADVVVTEGGNRPDGRVQVLAETATRELAAPVTYASYDIPEPVVVADVNRDGLGDVVTLHGGWLNAGVYTQTAGGTLTVEALSPIPYASHYDIRGLAVGDVTGDGKPDVVAADYNNGLVVLPQT